MKSVNIPKSFLGSIPSKLIPVLSPRDILSAYVESLDKPLTRREKDELKPLIQREWEIKKRSYLNKKKRRPVRRTRRKATPAQLRALKKARAARKKRR